MDHIHQDIPGFLNFREVYDLALDRFPQGHFVEIGAYCGKSAAYMAVEIVNRGLDIRLDVVDNWTGPGSHPEKYAGWKLLKQFRSWTAPVGHVINVMPCGSPEAAALYDEASLDFVMIDGDHRYEAVLADIDAWWPKVRPGGLLTGDDYHMAGVSRAVDERFGGSIERLGPAWIMER